MDGEDMTTTEQRLPEHEATEHGVRDRVALVTGGTRGIGEALSRRLARQGAHLAVGYWRGEQRAHEFQIQMKSDFPDCRVTLHKGNIGVAEHCRQVVREVIDQHGRLDILINNAGITADRTVAKMGDEEWRKVLDVNLSGAFFVSQAAMAHMVERGTGRIIDISSVIGETGNIGQANYAASKSGLFGLTKSLALEAAFQLKRSGKLDDGVGLTVNNGRLADLAFRDFLAVDDVANELGTEGGAAQWGSEIEGDPTGKARLVFHDDPAGIVGQFAVRFRPDIYPGMNVTAIYPAKRNAGLDFSNRKQLSFWMKYQNPNSGGFQDAGPVVWLDTPKGRITFKPAGDRNFLRDAAFSENRWIWQRLTIPLAGGDEWKREDKGTPDLKQIDAIGFAFDSWESEPFTVWLDGLTCE